LRAAGCVRRIVVIGPGALADHPAARGADAVLPEADSSPGNVLRGLAWLREDDKREGETSSGRVLVVTTDLPFLTPRAILDFLSACPEEADVCVPLLRREAFEARFPASPITYARLRDGERTMACAFLVNPAAIEANRVHLEKIFAARKSEIAMARLLGFPFVARYLTRRLTVAQVERRCGEILGCRGAAVIGAAPELAFDIDRPEEYRYAKTAGAGN
jgi:hypothetical protein